MSQTFSVLLLSASTRPNRIGPAVADWFRRATRDTAADLHIDLDPVDLGDLALPMLDEPAEPSEGDYQHPHTLAWSARVAAADAIVVVTPEYNGGMPAALKNALDYLYDEWAFKPVLFVGYGNTSAGTRSVQMARQVTTALRMVPTGADLFLRLADSRFGDTVAPGAAFDRRAATALAELHRIGTAVRPLTLARRPAPSAPAASPFGRELWLHPAGPRDAAELLVLQRCCWVDEAIANATLELGALRESLDDVTAWLAEWSTWCLRRNGRLIGAVRARRVGDSWLIGRLMVAPDQRGRGLGRALLRHAEAAAPASGIGTLTLSTGRDSTDNLRLYRSSGYRESGPDGPLAVRLVKRVAVPVGADPSGPAR
ncbi:bifunctional NAD(P)H-dependent oxidoreductase/GNAT family N-acetyltransferase [Actinocatenispora sera]|uniref:bifunctional NAD(P)H-dependent oxidoreductase/GNAT family N-acetyltransferase n=1 Tax=Actinocatenispora sera TaxID=390989 RepID=UPI0033E933F0